MKKNVLIFIAVALFTASGLVYAQEMKGGMMGSGMTGKGMMDGKMMGMHGMMMKMMDRNVVATSDGGIVIVAGNKLTKFDKDLNLVKEVELKMDTEGMQKMMDDMKSMCPMMGKGMMGGMDKDSGAAADAVGEVKEVDHTSHH